MDYGLPEILKELQENANPKSKEGMARFGINTENAYGLSVTFLRKLAKKIPPDHQLALKLWDTGIHEARMLGCLVDIPERVTLRQMEHWVKDFNSWDICDQVCLNLFDKTPFAFKKAVEWSKRKEEFVKRAGFSLMACLAVHDKKAQDKEFYPFFDCIKREAGDNRNFVKKAVNWALRQIGKRNSSLLKEAVKVGNDLKRQGSKSSRWIAADALREFSKRENLTK